MIKNKNIIITIILLLFLFLSLINADDSKKPRIISSELSNGRGKYSDGISCRESVNELIEKNGYEILYYPNSFSYNIITQNSTHALLNTIYNSPIQNDGIFGKLILNEKYDNNVTLTSLISFNCILPPNPLKTKIDGITFIFTYDLVVDNSLIFKIYDLEKELSGLNCKAVNGPFNCIINIQDIQRDTFSISFFIDIKSRSSSTDFTFDIISAEQTTRLTMIMLRKNYYITNGGGGGFNGIIENLEAFPKEGMVKSDDKLVTMFQSTRGDLMASIYFFEYSISVLEAISFDGSYYTYLTSKVTRSKEAFKYKFGAFGNVEPIEFTFTPDPQSILISNNPTTSVSIIQGGKTNENITMMQLECQTNQIFDMQLATGYNNTYYNIPYGLGNGNEKNFTLKFSIMLPNYISDISYITLFGVKNSFKQDFPLASLPKSSYNDTEAPTLEWIEYDQLPNLITLLRVRIKDNYSGFAIMIIFNTIVTPSDLISGNLNDGIYEKRMRPQTMAFPTIQIRDRAGNLFSPTSDFGYPYINMNQKLEPQPGIYIDIDDITVFYFDQYDIDLSNFGSVVTVFLNYRNSSPEKAPFFSIFLKGETIANKDIFEGLMTWDNNKKLFKKKFYLPPRLMSGNVSYKLLIPPFTMGVETLYSKFGESALLRVKSIRSDELPPLVSNAYFNVANVNLNENDQVTITLTLHVDDSINGLQNGNIMIGSDFDGFSGFTFEFNPTTAKNVNPYFGIYEFSFTLEGNCRSQTFSIKSLELIDRSGHKSNTNDQYFLNPMFRYLNQPPSVKVNCNNNQDNTPPIIKSATLSKSSISNNSIERFIELDFIVYDSDSGISQRHIPFVYFEDLIGGLYETRPIIVKEDSSLNTVHFKLSTTLPFGLGIDNGIYISIYGIYDKHLNIAGYSSLDLMNLIELPIIETVISTSPILESYTSILFSGSSFYIYGNRLGTDESIVSLFIDFLDGNGFKEVLIESRHGSTIKTQFVTPYQEKSMFVKVIVDGLESNELIVIPIPFLESPNTDENPINYCIGTCGYPERGYCPIDQSGCICNSPFSGSSCNEVSQGIEINPIEKPDIQSNHTIGDEIFSYQIQVLELIEYNIFGDPINNIKFDKWTFFNLTTTDLTQYVYSTNFTHNSILTNINVFIKYFKKADKVLFANRLLDMSAGTIKYQVELSNYQFSSRINSLALLMKTSISSNKESKCQNTSNGNGINKNSGNSTTSSEFVQIEVNGVSLFGKLIKLAIIDDKVQQVSNKITNQFPGYQDLDNSPSSYISIQIPFFSKQITLDPDFSILISSESRNQCLDDNSNSKFTIGQLAGIIVSSIVGGLLVLFFISYTIYKKYKYSNFFTTIKENIRIKRFKKPIEVSLS